ncbi:hypothetical protein AB0L39_29610 [Streptomyces parvus]|uniref:hypothetical protein n=1 Tax=Streptomyces parvus TaxID=66428 RepID=UPI00343CD8C9
MPTLTDDDLRRRINLPAPDPDGEREGPDQALRTAALHLAVLRAMADHGLKKVLVYLNLTSDARPFARELPHTLRRLARTDPHLVPTTLPETLFVHDEAPQQREKTFARFARAPTASLTNARVVAEGGGRNMVEWPARRTLSPRGPSINTSSSGAASTGTPSATPMNVEVSGLRPCP